MHKSAITFISLLWNLDEAIPSTIYLRGDGGAIREDEKDMLIDTKADGETMSYFIRLRWSREGGIY